jgi:hypothetical protein
MDKIDKCRNEILDLCCPDGAKEFVREAVASILLKLLEEKFTSTNSQSDAIISDIKEVVQSWFKCNDNLTHRECDILNSVVKCYRQK